MFEIIYDQTLTPEQLGRVIAAAKAAGVVVADVRLNGLVLQRAASIDAASQIARQAGVGGNAIPR